MAEVEISREYVQKAAQHQAVRKALRQTADRVRRRADSLAASESVSMNTWVEEGTRPGWRPQAVVYGDNVEQEWGGSRTDRRRIMGRAAEEG